MNAGGVSTPDLRSTAGVYNYACQWGAGVNYSSCTQQTNTLTITTASNWLSGWSYRKQHNITNSTGADVNYTVQIIVVNGTSADSGNIVNITKARSDFGDIRFTNSTGSLLNYWIETLNSGANATFWVQITGNLTSTNQTIYIYYGNSTATNVSNGDNTFLFFDDFLGSSLNANKWHSLGGDDDSGSGGTITVSGGILDIRHYYHGFIMVEGNNNFSYNTRLHVRWYSQLTGLYSNNPDWVSLLVNSTGDFVPSTSNAGAGLTKGSNDNLFWEQSNGANYQSTGDNSFDVSSYRILDYYRNGTSSVNFYVDGVNKFNANTYVPTGNLTPFIRVGSTIASGAHDSYTDYVFVSKYVNPEPAHRAWGSEEP
jgi:hypothetical protein